MTLYDQAALDRIRARHHDDLEVSAVVAEVEWRRAADTPVEPDARLADPANAICDAPAHYTSEPPL